MGAALSSCAEWISATDNKGKLDFSRSNETLLKEIVQSVETLVREHPKEAEVAFKNPFQWQTSLSLTEFSSLKPPDYNTKSVPPYSWPNSLYYYYNKLL